MTGVELAIAAFTAADAVRALAYLPQIARIAQDKGDAGAVSCATWSLFAISHLATIVYALCLLSQRRIAVPIVPSPPPRTEVGWTQSWTATLLPRRRLLAHRGAVFFKAGQ